MSDLKRYVDAANKAQAERQRHLREVRGWRFDTIAVHGAYSAAEAIERNQGSIIEPLYLSSAQAFRKWNIV